MIPITELMIGNVILSSDKAGGGQRFITVVEAIERNDFLKAGIVNGIDIRNIAPIRMTDEILTECGFENQGSSFGWHNAPFHFLGHRDKGYQLQYNNSIFVGQRFIKALHELQNFYLVLAGKELDVSKIKDGII